MGEAPLAPCPEGRNAIGIGFPFQRMGSTRDVPGSDREARPRLRRGHGHPDPGVRPQGLRLRRQGGGERPPHAHPPGPRRGHPRPLLRRRLRRGGDQHLRLLAPQARRVRARPPHLRGELPGRHPGPPRRRAARHARPAPLRGRLDRARPACCPRRPTRRSRQHHRRRAGEDLLRAGARASSTAAPTPSSSRPSRTSWSCGPRCWAPTRPGARRLRDVFLIAQPTLIDANGRMLLGTDVSARAGHPGAAAARRDRPQLLHRPRRDARERALRSARSRSHYVSVLPNAGLPENVDGRAVYKLSPDDAGRGAGRVRRRLRRGPRGRLLRHHARSTCARWWRAIRALCGPAPAPAPARSPSSPRP